MAGFARRFKEKLSKKTREQTPMIQPERKPSFFGKFKKRLSTNITNRREKANVAREKREETLQELGEREIAKQQRITKVREAQLKRASLEAKILTAKARQAKAKQKISTVFRQEVKGGFGARPQRPVGAALMDFNQPIKKGKKQKRKGNTGGLGTSFRIV